jgi:hypothetical protein
VNAPRVALGDAVAYLSSWNVRDRLIGTTTTASVHVDLDGSRCTLGSAVDCRVARVAPLASLRAFRMPKDRASTHGSIGGSGGRIRHYARY